jgi:hypothetical protein
MKTETKIRILGFDYRLIADPDLRKESGDAGQQCGSMQFIKIAAEDAGLPYGNETLIHELIEAINSHLQLKLEHPQIQALGAGLFSIIADNPQFFSITVRPGEWVK